MAFPTTPDLADEFLLALAEAEGRGMSLMDARNYFRPELSSASARQMHQFMSDRRWIEVDIQHRVVGPVRRILPDGWDRIKALQNPSPSAPGQTINIGPVNNHGQFAVGDNNTQIQNFGIDPDALASILDLLSKMQTEFPDDAALKDIEAVLVDEDEAATSKRTALMWLRDVATRAVGSAAGEGIIAAVDVALSA